MTVFFVVSLPRTGTTSLCEMADICGLRSMHVLKQNNNNDISLIDAIKSGYNFFADTPFYDPSFLHGVLTFNDQYNIKFIYSHRDSNVLEKSIYKLYSYWLPKKDITNLVRLQDKISYEYIISKISNNFFDQHYDTIKYLARFYGVDMLDYSFSSGWDSFCNFCDVSKPDNIELPHKDVLIK